MKISTHGWFLLIPLPIKRAYNSDVKRIALLKGDCMMKDKVNFSEIHRTNMEIYKRSRSRQGRWPYQVFLLLSILFGLWLLFCLPYVHAKITALNINYYELQKE